MAAPPDLRVLCRRLTSTPIDDLPRACPLLVSHVLRCGGALSAPLDAKDKSSETPMLVHKLRTHITTLLTGKNPAGRFAAVCLVKAVIDVGGWESLRASQPWIRGLIGVLQVCWITSRTHHGWLANLLRRNPTLWHPRSCASSP